MMGAVGVLLYCRATGFVESTRWAVASKRGAHAPLRVVLGALAEDGSATGHASLHLKTGLP